MRLLVTGRDGQVARSLAERGRATGIEVVALGRPDLDLEDLTHLGSIVAAQKPDVIVSAAAYTAVDKAESEARLAYRINAEAPRVLGDTARQIGVPIIHLSTDYVFDGTKVGAYVETDTPNPSSVYGASKLEGERAVADATADHIILRVSWLFSPFGHNFVRTMLRLAETRGSVRVVNDQRGCPTSSLDVADAILRITRFTGTITDYRRGLFHYASSQDASWAELARFVFEASTAVGGPQAEVIAIGTDDYPTAARRPINARLDGTKLERAYGIAAPDWRAAVSHTVRRLVPELKGEERA